MSKFKLSRRSIRELDGVHPDLVRVVVRAIQYTDVDFGVIQGVRTQKEHLINVAKGATATKRTRHIPENNECMMSCAVDLGAWVKGKWDFNNWRYYERIAMAMFRAAFEEGVEIEWGGFWWRPKDGMHFQLPWRTHP